MKIIVQNLLVRYYDEGKGRVILFLHGWQDDLRTFDYLVPFFSDEWRIIRLDLPGFGESEKPNKNWDLNDYVQFLEEFIKKLDLSIEVIIGQSFGGRIILKSGDVNNFYSQKVVLIGAAGVSRKRNFRNLIIKILTKIGKLIIHITPLFFWKDELRRKMYKAVGSDYLDAGELKKTFLKVVSEDLTLNAKKIDVPTLLIWGENDKETPVLDGKKLSELIKNSEIKIIKNGGHFVHRENFQEVGKLIQDFL